MSSACEVDVMSLHRTHTHTQTHTQCRAQERGEGVALRAPARQGASWAKGWCDQKHDPCQGASRVGAHAGNIKYGAHAGNIEYINFRPCLRRAECPSQQAHTWGNHTVADLLG